MIKKFCSVRDSVKKMKSYRLGGNIFKPHIQQGLVPRLQKELSKCNRKPNQYNQKMGQRHEEISPMRIYEQQRGNEKIFNNINPEGNEH